ncbi:MAG: DUF5693 family protein [Halanaerobiales bacterium]
MKKKIIIGIFIIAIIASSIAVWGRYKAEMSADGVELIMEYKALASLDVETFEYLSELKENGLTAVAIYPDNIKEMLNSNNVKLIKGNELNRLKTITGDINPELSPYPFDENSAFFIVNEEKYLDRLRVFLSIWEEEYNIQYQIEDGQAVVFFPKWQSNYINLSLGFDNEVINVIKENDLKLIPRFHNNPVDNKLNWELMDELSPYAVIFAGDEVSGYNEENKIDLQRTAELMRQNYIVFGMIEEFIAKQDGADSLAYYLDFNILRVHSIQQREMDLRENYTVEKIVDRYIRAVRERNVRLLYLKPFLEEKNNIEAETATLNYVNSLSSSLKKAGYNTGSLKTFSRYRSPLILLLLTGAGIILAGIVLLEDTLGIEFNAYFWILLLLGALFEIGLIVIGRELLLRKILALGTTIVFPSLAIISQLLANKEKRWLIRFLKASLISLIGALFLSASLAHISFILKVDQFTGVKVSFLLPILFISIYYFRKYSDSNDISILDRFIILLEREIKVKHLLLLFLFGLGGIIYIARTGNNPILPVPDLELLFRDLLEKILYIRPRFKEFLIGHPFFILSLGLESHLKNKLVYFLLVILAAVGQINILNTFSHIHTPFLVSVTRTCHGIWIGLIIGILALLLTRYLLSIWKRKRDNHYA